MKILFTIATIGVFTISLALAQAAAPAAAPEAAPAAAPAKAPAKAKAALTGEIETIDTTALTIAIKDAKGVSETITLTAETAILSGGKKITLAELKVGEKIKVAKKGDAVTKVTVVPAKKAAPAKKP